MGVFSTDEGDVIAKVSTAWWGLVEDGDLPRDDSMPVFRKWDTVNKCWKTLAIVFSEKH